MAGAEGVGLETIVAVATPPGTGAVALLRISGRDAVAVATRATGGRTATVAERQAVLTWVLDGHGAWIDEVLLTVFREPRSFTGEDVVEIGCHGGLLVTRRVLERLLECGARMAEAGEFTQRAFENGKLDLTQAEAVMDLIAAKSDLALRAARAQLTGRLGTRTEAIRARLVEVVCHLEAWIDFPEDDIDPAVGEDLARQVGDLAADTARLLETSEQGRVLREGVVTVIYGQPNTGKSSLLNELAGHDRAIVSEHPGTTRDTIEETVNTGGIVLRLTDTAGVRDAVDTVEREGVRRTEQALEQAELVIEVVDGSLPPQGRLDEPRLAGRKHVLVVNKSDLGEHPGWAGVEGARVSCLSGEGIESLREWIVAIFGLGAGETAGDMLAINARHRDCLERAREALERAATMLRAGAAPEFTAVELREAMDRVGAVAGRVDVEEILGGIFSRFCIGK